MQNKKIMIGIFLLGYVVVAHADGTGIFDTILNSIYVKASTWGTTLMPVAAGIFYTVSTIEFAYAIAFKKMLAGDHQKLFYTISARFIVMSILYNIFVKDLGFYIGILKWGLNLGQTLGGGLPTTVSSGGIYSISGLFDLMWSPVWVIVTVLSGAAILGGAMSTSLGIFFFGIVGAIIVVILTCCVTVMWLLIRSWLVMFGGFFLAGFIGSHWTRNYWQNYIKSVISVALSLFTLSLVLIIIEWQWSHTSEWLPQLPEFSLRNITDLPGYLTGSLQNLIAMLGVLVLDAVLIIGGAGLGASLASGVISTGLGEAIGAVAGVMAGASMAGGAAKAAGTVAKAASGASQVGKQAAQASMKASLKNGIGGAGNSSDSKFREMSKTQAKKAGSDAQSAHMSNAFSEAKKHLGGAGRGASNMGNNLSRGTGGGGGGGPASINTNSPSHH